MDNTYRHCLATLLWSSVDEDGTPFDQVDALVSDHLLLSVTHQWRAFREAAESAGFDAEQHCARALHPDCEGDAWNAAAHDFILTRNHHGTGFWDSGRWAAPWDRKLTALAQWFGELDLYLTDSGEISAHQL